MKALDRKLLRDLRRMWSQALTIALVVASGLVIYKLRHNKQQYNQSMGHSYTFD